LLRESAGKIKPIPLSEDNLCLSVFVYVRGNQMKSRIRSFYVALSLIELLCFVQAISNGSPWAKLPVAENSLTNLVRSNVNSKKQTPINKLNDVPPKSFSLRLFEVPEDLRILPWQMSLFYRWWERKFAKKEITTDILSSPRDKWANSRAHRMTVKLFTWFRTVFDRFSNWALHHQKTFIIGIKASIIALIGKSSVCDVTFRFRLRSFPLLILMILVNIELPDRRQFIQR
jgi:hypothetical protein